MFWVELVTLGMCSVEIVWFTIRKILYASTVFETLDQYSVLLLKVQMGHSKRWLQHGQHHICLISRTPLESPVVRPLLVSSTLRTFLYYLDRVRYYEYDSINLIQFNCNRIIFYLFVFLYFSLFPVSVESTRRSIHSIDQDFHEQIQWGERVFKYWHTSCDGCHWLSTRV